MNNFLAKVVIVVAITSITGLVIWSIQSSRATHGSMNPTPILVQSEQDFILGMVPHHLEAIDSSNQLLAVASDSDIRNLAKNIIFSQNSEVQEMKSWYRDWYGEAFEDNGKYKPMMRSLEGLSAKESEARFVADMIGHHEHAVMMAKELGEFARRPELIRLSADIIRDQEAEIAQLKVWLKDKYGETPPMIDHSMHKM
jgi:uncharacterized protein (DUF305 family)